MIEFGKTLRMAREAKGLTPGQVAERTHMIVQTVEGLEREDFSKIVAPIYGRGFVKLYCEAVGLEPKPLVDAFMEIYSSGRGTSAAKSAPTHAAPPAPAPAPVAEPPPEPTEPVAAEPPPRVQTMIDFGAPTDPTIPAAPTARAPTPPPQASTSRYAAPMPIDDGFSMPAVNWRIVALGAAAVAIVVLTILGVRALYRVTMTAPEDEVETTEVTATAPAPTEAQTPTEAPTPTEAQTPAKAPVDRKPLPLKPFYTDSDHSTEQEKK
jgi:cytoskeletal protein RodZ